MSVEARFLEWTIRCRNKGPPPHILTCMGREERHLDKVARSSVSEVGYVGMVKWRLGEEGKGRVDGMVRGVEEENERRWKEGETRKQEDVAVGMLERPR